MMMKFLLLLLILQSAVVFSKPASTPVLFDQHALENKPYGLAFDFSSAGEQDKRLLNILHEHNVVKKIK